MKTAMQRNCALTITKEIYLCNGLTSSCRHIYIQMYCIQAYFNAESIFFVRTWLYFSTDLEYHVSRKLKVSYKLIVTTKGLFSYQIDTSPVQPCLHRIVHLYAIYAASLHAKRAGLPARIHFHK